MMVLIMTRAKTVHVVHPSDAVRSSGMSPMGRGGVINSGY